MRLYHGSNVEVRNPSLRYGRNKTDFGKGFYTTTQKEQAEKWTEIKLDRAKTGKKVVSVYEVDDALITSPELRIREFHGVDAAWLNFVVGCRKGQGHDYDLVSNFFRQIVRVFSFGNQRGSEASRKGERT